MTLLKVTSRGQITLRRDLLRHLGVEPGSQIEVRALPGQRVQLAAPTATQSIEGFIGSASAMTAKRASLEEIERAIGAGWAGST
jgi:bifunctional DNA-binding transcriptional regulator/antitoxin component of YhaV-PrlF toxin-antitoxin module